MIETMNPPPVAPGRAVTPAPRREGGSGPEENGQFADVLRERRTAAESEDAAGSGVAPEAGIDSAVPPFVQATQPDPDRGTPADAALGIGAAWLPPDLLLAIAQRDAAARRHPSDAAAASRATQADFTTDRRAATIAAAGSQSNPEAPTPPPNLLAAKPGGGIREAPENGPPEMRAQADLLPSHHAVFDTRLTAVQSTVMERTDAQASASRMQDQELAPPPVATSAVAAMPPRSPAPSSVHAMAIDTPVGSNRFAGEAAQRVVWLAQNGIGEAEIRVKPAELGPITVRLEMNRNEVTIQFAVSHPDTRMAVEDSLHRLEAMLAESGIALGGAHVGEDQAGGGFDGQRPGFARRAPAPVAPDTRIATAPPPGARGATRSLVDLFA